jgi:hypothetical protein
MTWPDVGDIVRLRTSKQRFDGRGVIAETRALQRFWVLATENWVGSGGGYSYTKGQWYELKITDILGFEPYFGRSEQNRDDRRGYAEIPPHPDTMPRVVAPHGAMVETVRGWVLIEPSPYGAL